MSRVTVYGDPNLTASNIKSGTSIFGVTGSYSSDLTVYEAAMRDGVTYSEGCLKETSSPLFTKIKSGAVYYYYEWYYECEKTIALNDYILFYIWKFISIDDDTYKKYANPEYKPLIKFSSFDTYVGGTQLTNWRYHRYDDIDIIKTSTGGGLSTYGFKMGLNVAENKFRVEYANTDFLSTTSTFNTGFKFYIYST